MLLIIHRKVPHPLTHDRIILMAHGFFVFKVGVIDLKSFLGTICIENFAVTHRSISFHALRYIRIINFLVHHQTAILLD